jgi:hypothetical protein
MPLAKFKMDHSEREASADGYAVARAPRNAYAAAADCNCVARASFEPSPLPTFDMGRGSRSRSS